jgi:lipoyl(octanoyl) transferase
VLRHVRLYCPGLVDYHDAWRWQQEAAAAVLEGAPEALAVLQHPPVYTFGRRGRPENLLVAPETLARRGAQVLQTDRGGDVTFHGPGQLVAYPILNLRARNLAPTDYVRLLEEVMLLTTAAFGLRTTRLPGLPGLWSHDPSCRRQLVLSIGEGEESRLPDERPCLPQRDPLAPLGRGLGRGASAPPSTLGTSVTDLPFATVPRPAGRGTRGSEGEVAKLGAVGVRIHRGVTTHGLALNVDPDLSWFDAIVPCGLAGVTVTSLARLLNGPLDIAAVESALLTAFASVFESTLAPASSPSFRRQEESSPPDKRLALHQPDPLALRERVRVRANAPPELNVTPSSTNATSSSAPLHVVERGARLRGRGGHATPASTARPRAKRRNFDLLSARGEEMPVPRPLEGAAARGGARHAR